MKTIIIFGNTLERAINKLEEVKTIFQKAGIDIVRAKKNSNGQLFEFSNGEKWVALFANKAATLGRRYDTVYVDPDITDPEILMHIHASIKNSLKF